MSKNQRFVDNAIAPRDTEYRKPNEREQAYADRMRKIDKLAEDKLLNEHIGEVWDE